MPTNVEPERRRLLRPAVDLDGDGVDELIIETSGYEFYEVSAIAWDGSRYALRPGG